MRKLSLLITAGVLGVLTSSASLLSCDHVKGTGEVVQRSLNVEPFHGIVVEGSMDVVLTQAADQSVKIEAQANIADLVTTTVKNGIWHIGTRESYTTNKAFVIHIGAPRIDLVHVEGSGSVKGTGAFVSENASVAIAGSGNIDMSFQASSIVIEVGGSGDVRLSGSCAQLKASIAGSGNVNVLELAAKDAQIDIAGSGNVSANATGRVDVDIAGSGNAVLAVEPASINQRIAGSGTVRITQ